ncbi:hypothetical protein FVEG_14820 [Fusarium verticillioides 7600]|uniref:Uncharacterized protein n=1 Tax=Gibberella moniliformis (strain M3125 / FGSC 7600) TaxID=334819 RepID=W7LHJ5_GIBM7|nr:hypothetical protein FVEG_14820 [Fusarium verticillioides 7600]EWG37976.1 hypothetical protein FVEG_14820 [Fusarium verticillioides 7600]
MGVKGPVKKLDIVPYRISGTEKLLILHLIPSAGSETETHVSQYPVGAHVFFYVLMLTKCYTYLGSLRSCTCIQNAYVRGLWRGFSYSDVHVQYMEASQGQRRLESAGSVGGSRAVAGGDVMRIGGHAAGQLL